MEGDLKTGKSKRTRVILVIVLLAALAVGLAGLKTWREGRQKQETCSEPSS